MKKIVLMMAVMAGIAFTVQSAEVFQTVQGVEQVSEDEYTKIDVQDLPQTVVEAIQKGHEGSTVKEAYVAGADSDKKFKVIITDKEGQDVTLILNEKGEIIS